jgi:hypothetical protein
MVGAEYAATMTLYAKTLKEDFKSVLPIWQFADAMENDHRAAAKDGVADGSVVRDMCHKYGHADGRDLVAFYKTTSQCYMPGDSDKWERLCVASAGPVDDLEWALMSGLTTLEYHGKDLAAYVPATWIEQ